MAAALAAALAAPAGAQPIDTFVSTGNAQARWIKDPPAPPGSADRDSIELTVTARSALDYNDAAWVSFLGLPSAPPATPPSFLYKVSDAGTSGGSVRLVMRFSDGGYGFLRPATLQAGRWVRADGAGDEWESKGGRACGSSGITYAAMLACHPGSEVTSLEIINDSGWLHARPHRSRRGRRARQAGENPALVDRGRADRQAGAGGSGRRPAGRSLPPRGLTSRRRAAITPRCRACRGPFRAARASPDRARGR